MTNILRHGTASPVLYNSFSIQLGTIKSISSLILHNHEQPFHEMDLDMINGLVNGNAIGDGDCRLLYSRVCLDDASSSEEYFKQFRNEIRWQKMYHKSSEVPRLVCVQGQFESGPIPLYRHPTDQSLPLLPFCPLVQAIAEEVAQVLGHDVNHCLIQLYRSGNDSISEHSDKTLDIVRGSSIVNVSLGAQRIMKLRTKRSAYIPEDSEKGEATQKQREKRNKNQKSRQSQAIPLPHGSMFVLGPATNMKWLHGIRPDKRLENQRSELEKAFGGERISLTFRNIGTFLNPQCDRIWGQGSTAKEQKTAAKVINGDETCNKAMIQAFAAENYSAEFDWESHYGAGFDVLHLTLI